MASYSYPPNWDVFPHIRAAHERVHALCEEGAIHCRMGRPHLGILGVNSPLGEEFRVAYDLWMTLRAREGDSFATSLGYGGE